MSADASSAYTGVAAAWDAGPSRLYDALARAVVSAHPGDVAGLRVLDIGAGTGAVSRALAEASELTGPTTGAGGDER